MCEFIVSICDIFMLFSCYFGRIPPWGGNCAVYKAFRNDPTTVGRRDAVRLTLPEYDRVGAVRGYAGTGKTAMLNRALLEKRGYGAKGLAPSAPAARTWKPRPGLRARPCGASSRAARPTGRANARYSSS